MPSVRDQHGVVSPDLLQQMSIISIEDSCACFWTSLSYSVYLPVVPFFNSTLQDLSVLQEWFVSCSFAYPVVRFRLKLCIHSAVSGVRVAPLAVLLWVLCGCLCTYIHSRVSLGQWRSNCSCPEESSWELVRPEGWLHPWSVRFPVEAGPWEFEFLTRS